MLRQSWIASSLNVSLRPRLPLGRPCQFILGSSQISNEPRALRASLHVFQLAVRYFCGAGVICSDWNAPGKNLLTEHLSKAHDEDLDVRLVIAKTNQPEVVELGEEAASLKKEFYIKENVVGKVTVFDGDNFVIEFRQR